MANEPTRKDAGIVTAYGAAVRGGYTGTYEDFCRQQANYAEYAQDVEEAKTAAVAAAGAASTSETNAGQSAGAAAQSATAAGQSAGAAAQSQTAAGESATAAAQSAGAAAQSATAAGQSAGAAAQSQTAAGESATAAGQSAGAAAQSATAAGQSKTAAESAAGRAEAAMESYAEMTAEAETLEPGSQATAELDRTGNHPVLKLGLPEGGQGDPGVSPTVTVTDITGGHRVTITDAEGDHTFDVMNGLDGTGAVDSVNGKAGAVVLDGRDLNVNNSASDPETIEEALGDVNRALMDKANTSVIAEEYDSTATYAVGDYCIHEGVLYKCNTAIATAEAWTAAHWTATAVMLETGGGGGVSDVQVNGTSVVQDGVANVPMAGLSTPGVAKVDASLGVNIVNGYLYITIPIDNDIKTGYGNYKPIVPSRQHMSTFYGLAKAAGDSTQSASSNAVGTYTESAKSAISQMLNAPEIISGTTPSITAKAGIMYVCGEVATLSITAPQSGIFDVVFTSGTTPTVLTTTGITFQETFTPEANKRYEINVLDGYALVAEWAVSA